MNLPILLLAAATGLIPQTAKKPPKPAIPVVMAAPSKRLHLVSPVMHVHPGVPNSPHVALTLDACMGKVDDRILSTLIDNKIKATVFVTARWLKRNPVALDQMMSHPDLFEIENHGARHLAAIDQPAMMYTVKAAGSTQALQSEIMDGAAAITLATGHEPTWYRGATAVYTPSAITEIGSMHFRVAG
jgi:peptidoglycan/xylan/chitin deacetylase (PgdA/CDA1 family)